MIAARTKIGRVHIFTKRGGTSLCSAEGSRTPLIAGENVAYLPLIEDALNDTYLCGTCRREYELRAKAKAAPAPKPAKKTGRQK